MRRVFDLFDQNNTNHTALLCNYRLINLQWKNLIESCFNRLKIFSMVYTNVFRCLHYDKTIYDQNYYKRAILLNAYKEYEITLPIVTDYELKLDDEILTQFEINYAAMPDEYYIFIDVWKQFPSLYIKPVPGEFLKQYLKSQFTYLEKLIVGDNAETALKNIITYCPVAYYIKNGKFCIITYANVVDYRLEHDFPNDSSRFRVFEVLYENKQYKATVYDEHITVDADVKSGDVVEIISSSGAVFHTAVVENEKIILSITGTDAILIPDINMVHFRKFAAETQILMENVHNENETIYIPQNQAREWKTFSNILQKVF